MKYYARQRSLAVGERCRNEVAARHTGQRPDAIPALLRPERLEERVAALLGKEAAVWMPSGTMAQQIALHIHADRRDSQRVAFTVPNGMVDVANGRLRSTTKNSDGTTTYEWGVVNPINNYAIAVAAGTLIGAIWGVPRSATRES